MIHEYAKSSSLSTHSQSVLDTLITGHVQAKNDITNEPRHEKTYFCIYKATDPLCGNRTIDQLANLHFVSALVLRSHYIQISTCSIRYVAEPLTLHTD